MTNQQIEDTLYTEINDEISAVFSKIEEIKAKIDGHDLKPLGKEKLNSTKERVDSLVQKVSDVGNAIAMQSNEIKVFPFDHISASFIKTYTACRYSGKLYKDGMPTSIDPGYAEAGSRVHSEIERRYTPTAEPYVGDNSLMTMEMWLRFYDSMEGYSRLVAKTPRLVPNGTQQTEVEFHYEVAPGVDLLGYIDLLSEVDGEYYIDDWKSSSSTNAKDDLQMRIYKLALSETRGIDPNKIHAILHYFRKDIDREPKYEGNAETKKFLMDEVVIPLFNNDFTPNTSKCYGCMYKDVCDKKGVASE